MNKFTKLVSSILLLLPITNGFQLSALNGRVIKNSVGAKREAFLSPYVSSYKSISIEPLSMSSGDAEGSDPNEIITARIKVVSLGLLRFCLLRMLIYQEISNSIDFKYIQICSIVFSNTNIYNIRTKFSPYLNLLYHFSYSQKGDVGGYYRTCVLNEAGKFRRLTGTMSDPDDSKTAEIYVEVCMVYFLLFLKQTLSLCFTRFEVQTKLCTFPILFCLRRENAK